jgi:hypothetical protein
MTDFLKLKVFIRPLVSRRRLAARFVAFNQMNPVFAKKQWDRNA